MEASLFANDVCAEMMRGSKSTTSLREQNDSEKKNKSHDRNRHN
jgi:hypothetical protein